MWAELDKDENMDPTAALESILHGHMMQDHVEALRDWMRNGGFAPEPRFIPVDCHEVFARFRKDVEIIVTTEGLEDGNDNLLFGWKALLKLEDSSDE